jgi:hypothetical protein
VAFVNVSNQNTNAQIVVSSIVRWTAGKNIERLNVNPCRYQKVQWRKLAKDSQEYEYPTEDTIPVDSGLIR